MYFFIMAIKLFRSLETNEDCLMEVEVLLSGRKIRNAGPQVF
jgi:hypothetical protein